MFWIWQLPGATYENGNPVLFQIRVVRGPLVRGWFIGNGPATERTMPRSALRRWRMIARVAADDNGDSSS